MQQQAAQAARTLVDTNLKDLTLAQLRDLLIVAFRAPATDAMTCFHKLYSMAPSTHVTLFDDLVQAANAHLSAQVISPAREKLEQLIGPEMAQLVTAGETVKTEYLGRLLISIGLYHLSEQLILKLTTKELKEVANQMKVAIINSGLDIHPQTQTSKENS